VHDRNFARINAKFKFQPIYINIEIICFEPIPVKALVLHDVAFEKVTDHSAKEHIFILQCLVRIHDQEYQNI
jgi:hypothetical protein